MITPRVTRLLRADNLRALQRTIVAAVPRGWAARRTAVVVSTRSAAEELRRRIEDVVLTAEEGACLLPDIVTRDQLYARLHAGLTGAPPLLTGFEREVLLRLSAEDARAQGSPPPFRLRPGLIAGILRFYDELRRRGRSIDTFDRIVRERLEPGLDTDKGAVRLMDQTRFLAATFAAFERRIGDSGRVDEHGLRDLLLTSVAAPVYRYVLVTVADEAAERGGLWPADFGLLSRLHGLDRIDVVATERQLETGFHQRIHEALPGIEEVRLPAEASVPLLLAPDAGALDEPRLHFVCRDREEELAEAARWIKQRARQGRRAPLERTAIVFQRPLPYLYLARQVFTAAKIPYQATDSLPLAAEPFAAAIDLIFAVIVEEGTRTALVELLRSPHWHFDDGAGQPVEREHIAAFDRALQEAKYLGGWDRLEQLAARTRGESAPDREAGRWRRASPAVHASLTVAKELASVRSAAAASEQLGALLSFVSGHERLGAISSPDHERHLRARAAILGALNALRDAHARFDDRPLEAAELVAAVRRWIEGQTFAPRTGHDGVLLVDTLAAAFVDADAVRIVGLVETDWPERTRASIFYPAALLRELGWPLDSDRLAAGRARFSDLLRLAAEQVSISAFTLEDDSLVAASPFLDDVAGAGLPVERSEPQAPVRVFEHEALWTAPVTAGALPEPARNSLELRVARTPSADPRYRGAIGAHPAEVYAVSRIERYLECPFKYYAGQVLRLEEERADESGLTPQERGQLLHGVFEAFFLAWRERGEGRITAANLAEAVSLFATVAEQRLAELPEADRALERTYLLGSAASAGLAERAFAFEIEHGVEVLERLLEYEFAGTFRFSAPDGSAEVRLRGKADRIDLLADGTLRVVDYKLGRAPKPSRALQLPIYSVCAEQSLDGRLGRSWTVGRAGYVAFREKNAFVELGGRTGNLEAALAEGRERFLAAIARIEAGDFPPSPDEPWTCTRCGFPHVCRKDYVGDE